MNAMQIRRVLVFGGLAWLIPFMVATVALPLQKWVRVFYESIMQVVLAGSVVNSAVLYFHPVKKTSALEGLKIGLAWIVLSVVLDVTTVIYGPAKLGWFTYLKEIGLVYLLIPMVTTGFGYVLDGK